GKPLDTRSDIFSFGVVIFELLAGRRPFEGTTGLEVLQAIIHRPALSLAELRPDVPVALGLVVEKALEKDPAERYQTMREMVVDLRRLTRLSGETPAASPPRRVRGLKRTAALILVAIVAGSALIVFRPRQPAVPVQAQYTQLTNFADSATSPAL